MQMTSSELVSSVRICIRTTSHKHLDGPPITHFCYAMRRPAHMEADNEGDEYRHGQAARTGSGASRTRRYRLSQPAADTEDQRARVRDHCEHGRYTR